MSSIKQSEEYCARKCEKYGKSPTTSAKTKMKVGLKTISLLNGFVLPVKKIYQLFEIWLSSFQNIGF